MASIQLSGSVGSGGSFAILGFANVTVTGNADLTPSLAQYSNLFIKVSSDGASLAVRKVTVPLNEGTAFVVENATSEGFAINVIGPAGTGVLIPSGQSALVYTDGTNYISLGFSGGGSGQPWIATVNHAASPFQSTAATVYIPVDSTGGTTIVVAPLKPADGQVFVVKSVTTSANFVRINIAGGEAGVFIEDPQNPGSFASSVQLQGIGSVSGWKYDAATLQWIGIVGFTPIATDTVDGLMSAADKTKLDGITPGAAVASVSGSNGIASSGGTTPNITWAGLGDIDATGLVDAISGPSPIPIAPASLQWTQGTLAPTLTQAQQANASAPQSMSFAPQAPGAAATNATNGTPGSFDIALSAPVTGGSEPTFNVTRGTLSTFIGAEPGFPTVAHQLWLGLASATAHTATNYNLWGGVGLTLVRANTRIDLQIGDPPVNVVHVVSGGVSLFSGPAAASLGGGVGVLNVFNAATEPTTNPAGGSLWWSFTNGALKWRSANGWTGNLAALGSGTLNTQAPNVDTFSSTVRTVSTATPTAFTAYTTASNTIGWITVRLKSKAATTAGGITTGDGAFAEYRLGYKNIAGTVTLSTAGLTLLGAVQTTNALLTSVLTAAAASATVVFSVTNVAGNTVDSLIDCTIDVC